MLDLLQQLWDEYALLVQTISDLTDDPDCECMESISIAISDTEEMKQLRKELRAAGVQIKSSEDADATD